MYNELKIDYKRTYNDYLDFSFGVALGKYSMPKRNTSQKRMEVIVLVALIACLSPLTVHTRAVEKQKSLRQGQKVFDNSKISMLQDIQESKSVNAIYRTCYVYTHICYIVSGAHLRRHAKLH